MNKQLIVATFLLLLLGIGSWTYLGTQVEVTMDGEVASEDTSFERVQPTREQTETKVEAQKGPPPPIQPAEAAPLEEKKPDPSSILDENNSILIHVVDGETKASVANCDVSMILADRSKQAAWMLEMQSDMLGFFRNHGEHYRTSSKGEVRLPTERPILVIASITDSLFGTVQIPSPLPDQLTIQLRPIRLTRVRVLDEGKKPVAFSDVALGVRRESGLTMEMVTKKTNEDGIASLSFPQDLLLKFAEEGDLYVGLRGVFNPPIAYILDVVDPPQEVIELILPKTSALAIKVLNAAGAICQGPMSITASFVGAFKNNVGDRTIPAYQAIAPKGEVSISQVACGANLHLRVDPIGGASFATLKKTIFSSDVPGRTKEVVFQIEGKFPEMTGRLVDENGQPMANQSVYFRWGNQVPNKRFKMRGWTIRTNAKGRFKVLLKDKFLETASERFLEFTKKDKFDSTLMIATTSLPLAGGDVFSQDVGDVFMVSMPVLLSGRVVDGQGKSVAGASVTLFASKKVSERLVQRMPKKLFTGPRIASCKTNRDGAFQIRGQSDLSEFVVQARKSGFNRARQMATAGAESVLISIIEPGFVTGTIVLPPALADEPVSITIESSSTGGYWRGHPEDDGTFKTDELQIGDYQFYCASRLAGERKLHLIESFSVEAGKTTDLGEIRLLENAKSVELNLVEPAELGERKFLTALILDANSQVELGAVAMVQATQSFLFPEIPFDLIVYLPGFREAIYRNVQASRLDLKLKAGIPLRLVVEDLGSLPDGTVLRLTMRSVQRSHIFSSQSFSAGEESATVRVPLVGSYEIFARLKRKGFRQAEVEMTVPSVEVKGSDTIQEVRLHLDPDSLKLVQDKWR